MTQKVRKAVVAAAGFGTRFLPQTKAMPKEMMPIIDKPIIQYIIEELVDSGITDIVIVTNYHKRSIEDHFDAPNAELTALLHESNKQSMLDDVKKISDLANIAYVRQKEQLGNIGPLFYAEHLIGKEPFIYAYGDDFIRATPLRFKQMIEAYEKFDASVASCVKVKDDSDYDKYGIVDGDQIDEDSIDMKTIVEKPGKANAPTDLASVSGFLLKPEIFDHIHDELKIQSHSANTQIQPAIQAMINSGERVIALKIKNGKFCDTGNKLEYTKTVVEFGLEHPEISEDFREYLKKLKL